ncbi:hypothetical protein AAMO2058_001666500 [Amorphochlora amoebiformis]
MESIYRWKVHKSTKFGIRQDRYLLVDIRIKCLMFLDMNNNCKSEFRMSEIKGIEQIVSKKGAHDKRKVRITFNGAYNRPYDVKFESQIDCQKLLEIFDNPEAQKIERQTTEEDIPDMKEYKVLLKSKPISASQPRLVVLNSSKPSMLVLDMKRKCKREIQFEEISSVEIPRSKDNMAGETCHMMMKNGANAVKINFVKEEDRIDFCDNLKVLDHEIEIKDYSLAGDPECLRFNVAKINKVGVHKERVIYIDSKKGVFRSINLDKTYKEVIIKDSKGLNLIKIERNHNDKCRLDMKFKNREPLHFLLESPLERERFLHRCRSLIMPDYYTLKVEDELLFLPKEMNAKSEKMPRASTDPNLHKESFPKRTMSDPDLESTLGLIAEPKACTKPEISPTVNAFATIPTNMMRYDKFNEKAASVFIGTWNVGQSIVYDSLDDFIPPNKFDIYAIGLQECRVKDRNKWELELAHHINLNYRGSESKNSYDLIKHHALREINLFIFVRKSLVNKVTNIEAQHVACGVGNVVGNKGGVGISFSLYDTKVCFVACHLAARSERLDERRNDYSRICREMHLGTTSLGLLSQFHHLFWFGDLNYRTVGEFSDIQKLWNSCKESTSWEKMWPTDQLMQEIAQNRVFLGFEEAGPLNFGPTYRFDKKSNDFSNKNFQNPSWTDRILTRSLPGLKLVKRAYYSAPNVFGSDHRPVSGVFEFVPIPSPDVLHPPTERKLKTMLAEVIISRLSVTSVEMNNLTVFGPDSPKASLRIRDMESFSISSGSTKGSSKHFSSISAQKLENLRAVFKSKDTQLRAHFYSDALEKEVKWVSRTRRGDKWKWNDEVKLQSFLPMEDFIQRHFVSVVLRVITADSAQNIRLGTAVFSLRESLKSKQIFKMRGKICGTLRKKVGYKPSTMPTARKKNRETRMPERLKSHSVSHQQLKNQSTVDQDDGDFGKLKKSPKTLDKNASSSL